MGSSVRPWRLAALLPLPAEAVRGFAPDLPVTITVPAERTPEAARVAVADAEILIGDFTALLRIDAELVNAAPHLAFVQQPTVGVEHIDLAACAAAGIPVANTAGANAVGVAEWCVMAALAVSRNLLWADAEVRAGRWPQLDLVTRGCLELSGRRVGIVGYGAVGAAAAERFAAFGCDVSYWSRRERAEAAATYRPLADLLATSDVLVVVIALGDETRGLLGADALRSLPRGAVVVNAARGGIVDEGALPALLDSGQLAGVALDVYDTEPLPDGSPLRSHDRVLLSPHVAGATAQARLRIALAVQRNLARAVGGEPVQDVVNGVDPVIRRR
ncbi:MAG: D-3-phosphoglycerate dehydrogenase / 2-oxoglutarate reductase [Frankiaceae bacterium]|jgi:D-3-phosphoglycerate dehydrogenase|nr:D-3-phosphoglycerate dehydrogenase / 2-oxoglutarate reductase [Frankiaceae bacterium]